MSLFAEARRLEKDAQALRARAEVLRSSAVAQFPTDGCPDWCLEPQGHAWDAHYFGDRAVATRFHRGVRRGYRVDVV